MHTKNPMSSEPKREEDAISFDEYWYIDYKEQKIRHISSRGLTRIKDLFCKKKHKVSDLYRWAQKKWASEEMMVFQDAIEHDNIKVDNPDSPRRYQMKNGWTISPKDSKYLCRGPLFDEAGKTLVNYHSKFRKYASIWVPIAIRKIIGLDLI